MTNIRILTHDDWSLYATASATNQAADAEAANVLRLDYPSSRRWRTTNLTDMQLTLDAGQSRQWDAILVDYTNAQSSATWQITSDDNSGLLFTGSAAYDSGVQPFPYPGVGTFTHTLGYWKAPAIQTYRYIGIEVFDATNPDGFFTAGVVYAGLERTPGLQADFESGWGFNDLSVRTELANGERLVDRRPRKKRQSPRWANLNEDDSMFFSNLWRVYGESTPFVVIRDPKTPALYSQDFVVFGLADSWREISGTEPDEYNGVAFSIEEI